MEDEKVKQLAETLKRNNLAASMSEAIEKAKSILNLGSVKSNIKPKDLDLDNENVSLNELMNEVDITPEQVKEEEKEQLDHVKAEISKAKEDLKEAEKNPEKVNYVKVEIEQIKEDVDKIAEAKTEEKAQENKSQPEQKDLYEKEKKINFTKVFGDKK